jgi:hypothetical protein
LGGLERLPTIFQQVPAEQRLLLDTGWWTQGQDQQDLLKAQTLLEAFQVLGYDLIHLTPQDLQMALAIGFVPSQGQRPVAIGADVSGQLGLPNAFTWTFQTRLGPATVYAQQVQTRDLKARLNLPSPIGSEGLGLEIYIVQDRSVMPDLAIQDSRPICIVLPADSDQPMCLTPAQANPMVISMGRFGRYVARLDLIPRPEGSGLRLEFAAIPVSEGLASHPELMELYKQYQAMVAASGLLASHRRLPLPDKARYVGSLACRRCHRYEYDAASTQPHAKAYATLQKVGSHLDPECVVCHVVGLDYEGGFVSLDQTPDLAGVGCEACHGPGWQHVRTAGRARTTGPRLSCLDCHSPDHSPQYADHAAEYLQKIHHWKEPKGSIVVKPH